jgi:hypothetical protein
MNDVLDYTMSNLENVLKHHITPENDPLMNTATRTFNLPYMQSIWS